MSQCKYVNSGTRTLNNCQDMPRATRGPRMVVHRYDPSCFKPIEIPPAAREHPVGQMLLARVASGALACWWVGRQHGHLCSVAILPNGTIECFVSCAALTEDPWEFFFREHMATVLEDAGFLERSPNGDVAFGNGLRSMYDEHTPPEEQERLRAAAMMREISKNARRMWKRAIGLVLWPIRVRKRNARLLGLHLAHKTAREAYEAQQVRVEQLKNRLDKNPHSCNYRAAFSSEKRLAAHHRRLFGQDYQWTELYQRHVQELRIGTRLLRQLMNSLGDLLDVLKIRESLVKREWLFQTLFPDDDLIDERLRVMGLNRRATANSMNYYTMAQYALSECCRDIDTWRGFEDMLTREVGGLYADTELGRFIARGIGMPRAYWEEHLEKRERARRRWQRAIRHTIRQARADKEDTARNAADAATQRAVRAAAAATVRPQRALSTPGPSHQPPPARWAEDAPDAGEQAKRVSAKAASIRAAKATKAEKNARAAHEAEVALEMARQLAIGDAILRD